VYILTNKKYGTLYIGVSSQITKRIWEHKSNAVSGFSSKYKTKQLVYYEVTDDIRSAIARKKQLKNWKRQWKIEMIDKFNPAWKDLSKDLI